MRRNLTHVGRFEKTVLVPTQKQRVRKRAFASLRKQIFAVRDPCYGAAWEKMRDFSNTFGKEPSEKRRQVIGR